MSTLKKHYLSVVRSTMKEKYNYSNIMEVPKLVKIVVNRGLGEAISNSKVVDYSMDQLLAITGQKPVLAKAKKSISNFKLRQGQPIGCKVTLRSEKMFDFMTKLIYTALPRIRDFRGIPINSFDGRGNYSLGIKEDNIFPEINLANMDRVRGFDITIVTTAKNDEEAYELLKLMGMPFRKN